MTQRNAQAAQDLHQLTFQVGALSNYLHLHFTTTGFFQLKKMETRFRPPFLQPSSIEGYNYVFTRA